MAMPFGKEPHDWLRLPSTISFLDSLSKVGKSHLWKTNKGRPDLGGGT